MSDLLLGEKIKAVSAVHAEIETATSLYSATSQVHCPKGCGACCENPYAESTVLDCFPLAQQLVDEGQGEKWYDVMRVTEERLDKGRGQCPLYISQTKGHGYCSVYSVRPSICRLFGFAARKNKEGKREPVQCKILKEKFPASQRDDEAAVTAMPLFDQYHLQLLGIDPALAQECFPLPKALRIALEKLLLVRSWEAGT